METKHIKGIDQFKTIPPFSEKENRPAFLRDSYIYPSGDSISVSDISDNPSSVYEIRCLNPECQLSIRLQGSRVESILAKVKSCGCPVCQQTDIRLYMVKN